MPSKEFKQALDKASAEVLSGEERRGHLGPSSASERCARKVWYGFRWAYSEQHTGRMLRLFNRGHEEEHRVVRWLRATGAEVRDYRQRLMWNPDADSYLRVEWDAALDGPIVGMHLDVSRDPMHIKRAEGRGFGPRQWGFKDDGGHYAGSSDGVVSGLDQWFPQAVGWGLLEIKTHSEKSFKEIVQKGVLTSKPTHYNQCQQYMRRLELPWCVYIAVNKNNDDIYPELVQAKPEVGSFYEERAIKIIEARTPPPRITEDPSWFECRFCVFREICHYAETPQKNCRSCVFASAGNEGSWYCNKYRRGIPSWFIPKGCEHWEPIK